MTEKQRIEVFKQAGNILLMEIIFVFVSALSIINSNNFGVWGLISWSFGYSVVIAIILVASSLSFRRVSLFYFLKSLAVIGWILPLIWAGLKLSHYDITQFAIVVFLSVISSYISYTSTTKKLINYEHKDKADIKLGYWDLNKTLVSQKERTTGEALAQVLIPIGVILGTKLSRSLWIQDNSLNVILNYSMAGLLASFVGLHLAIVSLIVLTEMYTGKKIKL
jgi:hypothetical protein